MSDRTKGVYRKYVIKRTDGSHRKGGKHEHCNYFVLDLDHDPYAIPALRAYAEACRGEYPQLAKELDLVTSGALSSSPSNALDALMHNAEPTPVALELRKVNK